MIEVKFEGLGLYVSRAKLFSFSFFALEITQNLYSCSFKMRQEKNELGSSV